MTTVTEFRTIIRDAFIAHRNANFNGMPTAWQNKSFPPPADGSEYMRVTATHQTGTRPVLGGGKTRRAGTIFVQIFTPKDEDMRRSDILGQSVLDFFANWPAGPVTINEPTLSEVGPDDAWFQVNVTATFQYDDFG